MAGEVKRSSELEFLRKNSRTKLITLIKAWHFRSCSRTRLSQLSDHELRDIGYSREEAEAESMKRFWMP